MVQDRERTIERALAVPAGEDTAQLRELFAVDGTLLMKSELPPGLIIPIARGYILAKITNSKMLSGYCIPGDEKVLCRNKKYAGGWGTSETKTEFVDRIEVGDELLTYNEVTSEKEFDEVVAISERMSDKIIKLKLSNGNVVRATPEHPFAVIDSENKLRWIPLSDIKEGDCLIQYKYKGLELRLRQLGKTTEEIYGSEKANIIDKGRSVKVGEDWANNYEKRKEAVSESLEKWNSEKAGKTYSEIYGEEKALEITQKQSDTHKELCKDPKVREKKREASLAQTGIPKLNLRKTMALPEVKAKMAKRTSDQWENKEIREKRSNGIRKAWIDKRMNWILSFNTEEYLKRRSEIHKELWKDLEYVDKVKRAHRKRWRDPELRKLMLPGLRKAQHAARAIQSKSGAEEHLEYLLEEWLKDEWLFVGNKSFVLDNLCPDFVNVNGKKKLIDLLGCYWHGCPECGFEGVGNAVRAHELDERSERFKKFGYEIIYVWEHELKDESKLREKIVEYEYNPNIEIVEVVEKEIIDYPYPVYDYQMKKNHNFMVFGVLVKNCDLILQAQISKDRKGRLELMEALVAGRRHVDDDDL